LTPSKRGPAPLQPTTIRNLVFYIQEFIKSLSEVLWQQKTTLSVGRTVWGRGLGRNKLKPRTTSGNPKAKRQFSWPFLLTGAQVTGRSSLGIAGAHTSLLWSIFTREPRAIVVIVIS